MTSDTMKLTEKVKSNFAELSKSISRYPLTVLISFIFVILVIVYNELNLRSSDNLENLIRFIQVAALGIPLSVSLKQLAENFYEKKNSLILTLPSLILLLGIYYFFYSEGTDMVDGIRFAGTLFLLLVSVFFTLKLSSSEKYEVYVIRIFTGFFLTVLYSAVLYFGISAIIFTINSLFDANIDSKYYFYFFVSVSMIFGVLMFLSKFPVKGEKFEGYQYSKGLKVLLLYIVIPLITIYTLILYVYFAKILLTSEWPRGLVSNLVLWYSVLSAAVIFFITPVLEENPVARLFRTWFPRIIFPILAMMFVSIGKRIVQYGFTEPRYYVVLLGIWVTLVMVYYVTRKDLRNIFLPVSLSIFVFVSLYGPLSGFSVSNMSQNGRLGALLEKNSMVQNGLVIPNANVPQTDRENISSIVSYFANRDITKIKYLDEEFVLDDFEKTFGFAQVNGYYYPEQEYAYIHAELGKTPVSISGYDYMLKLNSYENTLSITDSVSIALDAKAQTVKISEGSNFLLEVDLKAKLKAFLDNYRGDGKGMMTFEEASFTDENEKVRVKFIISDLNGRKDGDDYSIENLDMFVLVTLKP